MWAFLLPGTQPRNSSRNREAGPAAGTGDRPRAPAATGRGPWCLGFRCQVRASACAGGVRRARRVGRHREGHLVQRPHPTGIRLADGRRLHGGRLPPDAAPGVPDGDEPHGLLVPPGAHGPHASSLVPWWAAGAAARGGAAGAEAVRAGRGVRGLARPREGSVTACSLLVRASRTRHARNDRRGGRSGQREAGGTAGCTCRVRQPPLRARYLAPRHGGDRRCPIVAVRAARRQRRQCGPAEDARDGRYAGAVSREESVSCGL
ncbi:hypothetical protein HMPREF1486_04388 [Streptomyces sp. HPH0547]|nr:hypothetical protein HMPREF1486_04388 [Streptomyces sp. HPH0547]